LLPRVGAAIRQMLAVMVSAGAGLTGRAERRNGMYEKPTITPISINRT
jgi:hypothetical protein